MCLDDRYTLGANRYIVDTLYQPLLLLHGPCLVRAMPTPPRSARWDQTMSSHHVLSRLNKNETRDTHEKACGIPPDPVSGRLDSAGTRIARLGDPVTSITPPWSDAVSDQTLEVTHSSKHNGGPVCEFLPRHHQCKTSTICAVLYCAVCCVLCAVAAAVSIS